jgi:RNA polymerase sigma-70 factor, ECF subfamily
MGRVQEVVTPDIAGIEAPDQVDWAATYAAQRDRLMGLAFVILRDRNDAADAVQVAFEKALRHQDRLHEGIGPEAWLARITCNEAISLARRRRIRRWIAVGEVDDGVSQEGAVVDRMLVENALRRLRPKHRAVIALHYLYGYAVDDVASILSIPSGTVNSRLHHARETLRGILARQHQES